MFEYIFPEEWLEKQDFCLLIALLCFFNVFIIILPIITAYFNDFIGNKSKYRNTIYPVFSAIIGIIINTLLFNIPNIILLLIGNLPFYCIGIILIIFVSAIITISKDGSMFGILKSINKHFVNLYEYNNQIDEWSKEYLMIKNQKYENI